MTSGKSSIGIYKYELELNVDNIYMGGIMQKKYRHNMATKNALAGLPNDQYISLALRNVFYKIVETPAGNTLEIAYGKNAKGPGFRTLACARALYRGTHGSAAKLQITGPFHMDCGEQNYLKVGLEHIINYRPM